MPLRDRAFFATSALLYMGPLYAGLSGHGFDTIPLFAVIFMLWLHVARPGDWPATRAQWTSPRALAWPLLLFAGQMAVVAFCLVVGRGIGGLFGFTPALPFVFTLLMSMLAIGAARLLQRSETPSSAAELDGSLQFGSCILDMPSMGREQKADKGEIAAAVMDALRALPAHGATRAEIAPYVDFAERSAIVDELLTELAEAEAAHLPFVQTQAALALRPVTARRLVADGRFGPAIARSLASRVPNLVQEVAIDLRKLLPVTPGLAAAIPSTIRLQSIAADFESRDPFVARALRTLAEDVSQPKVA